MNHSVVCRFRLLVTLLALSCIGFPVYAQTPSNEAVIRGIDASVAARDENLAAYTVTEHYSVFRTQDKDHPSGELIVKTSYRKDQGKSYTIVSQTGSSLIRDQLFPRILQSERELTQPANRTQAVITSANYNMQLKGQEKVSGRDCLVLAISPRRASPYLFTGTLWVDAADYSIVQLQGIAAKSPSMFAGATQVSRTYDKIDRFPMAIHATAVSNSWLLGRTTIQIEYANYQLSPAANTASASGGPNSSK